VLNKHKETEIGQILKIDKRPNPAMDPRKNIRTFNWEGIHFEVSPKRDGSLEEAKDMHSQYANDLNLMAYNFNNSFNRNNSDSPKENHNVQIEAIPKISNRLGNKMSMNFIMKERCGTNNTTSSSGTNGEERAQPGLSNKNSGTDEDLSTEETIAATKRSETNLVQPEINIVDQKNQKLQRPPSPIANKSIVSKKLSNKLFQFKHNGSNDENVKVQWDDNIGMAKFKDKIMNLKSQIQEDIDELSGEEDQ
jgi:hypothetical protein